MSEDQKHERTGKITEYSDAISAYLDAATWLTDADAPFKVHARAVARSLDRQITKTGEIQSAMASSWDKVMVRLEARRPKPIEALPSLSDTGPLGEESIFTAFSD